jgi:diguanylate cyclase
VPLLSGLAPGAAIVLAAAVVSATALVRAARRPVTAGARPGRSGRPGRSSRSGRSSRGFLALAAALPAGALGLVAAAVGLFADPGASRTVLAAPVAAGSVVSIALVLAGVLALPGMLARRGTVNRGHLLQRHVLDGFVIAASVFYVAWTLLIEPLHRRYAHGPVPLRPPVGCLVVAGPLLVGLVALGVLVAVVLKSSLARRACLPALAPIGTVAAAPTAVYLDSAPLALFVALAYAVSGAGLGYAVRPRPAAATRPAAERLDDQLAAQLAERVPDQPAEQAADQQADRPAEQPAEPAPDRYDGSQRGLAVSLVLVGLALTACVIRMVFFDAAIDAVSVGTAVAMGASLAAQQALARVDLRRTTDRLLRSEAHFRSMAYTDALTGLANRRQLFVTLAGEAVGGPPCVLLAIDLDGFKNINDTRGHDVGDSVLVEVAHRLCTNLRPGDLAVRMGGDEFAVLMWGRPPEAKSVADRLHRVLCQPYDLDVGSVFLSASIGLAGCATADTIEGLIHNADVALRFAKQRGKHRVEQYDLAYDQWLRRRTELEHELRGAVDRGELMLVYQPIVRLPEGRVGGVEALLRWHHPRLGSVPPDEFIPLAEEAGLIVGLGAFVLHQAVHQLSRWLADGQEIYVAVNVSVRELHTPDYATRVAEVLRGHRVPPERLVVEVTEHAVALDVQQLVERLTTLRAGGVRVALDDFGSGYSSLGQLRTLPVDILKIDRALIAPTGAAPVRFAPPLADVVVQLGNRLGLDVVAEGITDPGQRRVLEEAGCRFAQGDLFGRAMPAERVEALFGAEPVEQPVAPRPRTPDDGPVRNMGSVDSGREMRQS